MIKVPAAFVVLLLAAPSWIWPGTATAQAVRLTYLEGLLPVAPDALTPLGSMPFGERINLHNGALSFQQTDLQVPGNGVLPVALTRHFNVGRNMVVTGAFGDWDNDTPRISGVFGAAEGWVSGDGMLTRCSRFNAPPPIDRVSADPGGIDLSRSRPMPQPLSPSGPPAAGPSAMPDTMVTFNPHEFWQGTTLHVPGQESQELLVRHPAYAAAPADGYTYPVVTRQQWQLRCLGSLHNAAGEGFEAVSPDGVRYRFDWMASRHQLSSHKAGAYLSRSEFFLMATEVRDRFNNFVRYTYDPQAPLNLLAVAASDGRQIQLQYQAGRVSSATEGGRTVLYSYGADGRLSHVTLPDNSQWVFNLAGLTFPYVDDIGESATCDFSGYVPENSLVGTISHPAGAVGRFTTAFTRHGRSNVPRYCFYAPRSTTKTIGAVFPKHVASQTLLEREISGPGLPTLTWSYVYDSTVPGPPAPPAATPSGCTCSGLAAEPTGTPSARPSGSTRGSCSSLRRA